MPYSALRFCRKAVTIALACSAMAMQAQSGVQIRRNQVGCYPWQEKVVVVEGTNPKGKLRLTLPDGRVVKPRATVRKAVSPLSGKVRYVVDLGNLDAPGCYQVSVGNYSCGLNVDSRPLADIATASLRLFYLMRSGVPIDLGGPYNRPAGHPDTLVVVHPSAASPLRPAGTVISSPLGWYDAGDYNKYVVNSAFSIGLMMAAYEQRSDYFARLNTNIPESANSTPDILDEMMFNLQWLFTMQDPYDGGVYHKLTTPDFEGFILPSQCRQQRYVVAKSVTATLDFAAVMADAARLFAPFSHDYPAFSAQAAAVAERAYQWAKANPTAFFQQDSLATTPPASAEGPATTPPASAAGPATTPPASAAGPAITTGTYADDNAADEFFWAASALYRLTGKQAYLDDAISYMPRRFTTPSWGGVSALGAFEWLASSEENAVRQAMRSQLVSYCDEAVSQVAQSSFQAPYGNRASHFGWGCLAEFCCCQGMALLYADHIQGNTAYRAHALQNVDYLLGRNATGYCYVTGFGDKSPLHPHHRISAADGVQAPFPGMLVGGPNPGQQDKPYVHTPYPSDYPDESYLDETESYASNEIAINWNASLVAFLCWLDSLWS